MKNVVIFDLEATCWAEQEHARKKGNEIIEIGAVRIDKYSSEILDKFDIFVKPTINPILTEYCINLTTIKQSDVDTAKYDFKSATSLFNDWLQPTDEHIMSWGFYDKNQIINESNIKNLYCPLITKLNAKHINMKNQFAYIKKIRPCGMEKALKILGLELDGTHHRAIDDVINMVKIYEKFNDSFFNV